jgi:hypothetical protein
MRNRYRLVYYYRSTRTTSTVPAVIKQGDDWKPIGRRRLRRICRIVARAVAQISDPPFMSVRFSRVR